MGKWEYKVYIPERDDWGKIASKAETFEELDIFGKEGWELVHVMLMSSPMSVVWGMGGAAGCIFFFKRRLS